MISSLICSLQQSITSRMPGAIVFLKFWHMFCVSMTKTVCIFFCKSWNMILIWLRSHKRAISCASSFVSSFEGVRRAAGCYTSKIYFFCHGRRKIQRRYQSASELKRGSVMSHRKSSGFGLMEVQARDNEAKQNSRWKFPLMPCASCSEWQWFSYYPAEQCCPYPLM